MKEAFQLPVADHAHHSRRPTAAHPGHAKSFHLLEGRYAKIKELAQISMRGVAWGIEKLFKRWHRSTAVSKLTVKLPSTPSEISSTILFGFAAFEESSSVIENSISTIWPVFHLRAI